MITVNGEKVQPWNPFAPGEPARSELAPQRFEVVVGDVAGTVTFSGSYCRHATISARPRISKVLSGPLNWNRQQGLYIYRAGRLVQWGGWNGIRGIDEHTKLARAALDFDTDLDSVFNINVAKMRVTHPPAAAPDARTADQRAVRPGRRPLPKTSRRMRRHGAAAGAGRREPGSRPAAGSPVRPQRRGTRPAGCGDAGGRI